MSPQAAKYRKWVLGGITLPMVLTVLWFALRFSLDQQYVRADTYTSHLVKAQQDRQEILAAIETARNENNSQHAEFRSDFKHILDLLLGRKAESQMDEKSMAEQK